MPSLTHNTIAMLPIPKGLHPSAQGWLARGEGGEATLGPRENRSPTLNGLQPQSGLLESASKS